MPILTRAARLRRFLGSGYFPKELPPVFVTAAFAENHAYLRRTWPSKEFDHWKSVPETFSMPRSIHTRRSLAIVNPINEFKICAVLCDNWQMIRSHIKRSTLTEFSPIIDILGERAVPPANYVEIARKQAHIRAAYPRALRSDITRFYPSIYTHSIAWALHGKTWAKENLNKPSLNNSVGGRLDRALRQSQDNQTIGIAIGPDSSRIIAEIITAAIDHELAKATDNGICGLRYHDDFLIGLSHQDTDAAVASKLRAALKSFELEINADKTSIDSTGERDRPQWARRLLAFTYDQGDSENSIGNYFDEMISLFDAGPTDAVVKYGIKRSRSFVIPPASIAYYIDRLIHMIRLCPAALPVIVQATLERNRRLSLDAQHIYRYIIDLISENATIGNSFEVTWLLFLARGLNMNLKRRDIESIFLMESSPVALIAMDLNRRKCISRGIDESIWRRIANADGLQGPMWLLAYEAALKGWWRGISDDYVRDHPLFGKMLKRGVHFYDEARNVRTTRSELRRIRFARRRYSALFHNLEEYI